MSGDGDIVIRRALLFQVDLSTPAAQQAFGDAISEAGVGSADIRINQPDDYDSPASSLYWRNILQKFDTDPNKDGYKSSYQKIFNAFIAKLYADIDTLTLKTSTPPGSIASSPFVDLTDLITGGFDGYASSLDETNNTLKFSIENPSIMKDGIVPAPNDRYSFFQRINVRENDVLMVRVSRNGGPFELEFIGQVVNLNQEYHYGTVIKTDLEIAGLSKAFYTSQIITKRALSTNQFLPGIEINSVSDVTVYEGRFNPKTARAIFREIMEEALLSVPFDNSSNPNNVDGTDLYTLNQGFFNSNQPQGFQFDFFLFLALYIMSKTAAAGDLWYQPNNQPVMLLDQSIRGLQEAGDYPVFNPMIAKGFSTFFSQLQYPHEVLDNIRENVFMDVFESRNGIVISRPPRYNRIDLPAPDLGDYNLSRISAEQDDQVLQGVFSTIPGGWVFNNDSDFVIGSDDLVGDIELPSDELDVETRIDTKWMMPLNNAPDIAAGSWTDPTLLIRYGFRSKAPVNNPNVLNPRAARMFSPIALAWVNAKTRRLNLSVKDNRVYYPGRLYYVQALNIVAYLVEEVIVHGYERISQRTLSFSMVRKVVSRSSKDILASENELYNFALCYCDDITPKDLADSTTCKQAIRDRGKALLARMTALYQDSDDSLGDQALLVPPVPGPPVAAQTSSMTVPMFKYLPNILDLIIEVEVDSTLANTTSPDQDNSSLKNTQASGVGNEVAHRDSQGRIYVPLGIYGYPQPGVDNFGQLVSSDDSTNSKYLDSAYSLSPGALGYGPEVSLPFIQINPSKGTPQNPDFEDVQALRTPFLDAKFVDTVAKFSMSQLLMNMLVSLDLSLKYVGAGNSMTNGALALLSSGVFPQFFTLGPNGFELFFSGSSDPSFDTSKLSEKWQAAVNLDPAGDPGPYHLDSASTDSLPPNILKLKLDSQNRPYFENKYFQIFQTSSGEYNMPMGYFVTLPTGGDNWRFTRLANQSTPYLGGKIKLASPPLSSTNVIFEAVDTSLGVDAIPLSSTNPTGIYFITPWAEVTVERLLDVNLPPSKGGQYTAQNVNTLKSDVKASRPAALLLEENQSHSQGRAIDLSPDYLVASSQSDLTMRGSAGWNTGGPLAPLLAVFQDRIIQAGFSLSAPPNSNTPSTADPKRRSFFFTIPSAMTGNPVYPNGTPAKTSPLGFFHLEVSQADISAFKKWLRPPNNASLNTSEIPGGQLPVQDQVAPGSPKSNTGAISA